MSKNQILMCSPDFFNIEYSINSWMHLEVKAEKNIAQKQWHNLYNTILELNTDIKLINPVPGLPDLVFIDAGFLYHNVFIPSNFMHPERQGENKHFKNWFANNGYEIIEIDPKFKFEGHGDNLWAGNKVFCGFGFRSSVESFEKINKTLNNNGQFEMIFIELINPSFYHLDTCFCPINENQAIYYRGGLSPESITNLANHIQLIELPKEDAMRFACNSLVLGKNIIIPAGCEKTCTILENLGYKTYSVEISEFIKAGGACKCLCMPL